MMSFMHKCFSSKKSYLTLLLGIGCQLMAVGQGVHVYSAENTGPMNGARVFYHTADDPQEDYLTTNDKGLVTFAGKQVTYPLYIRIVSPQYQEVRDTLEEPSDKAYHLRMERNKLNEIVVTGQYAPGSSDKSVHVVKVINRAEIDKMAAQNLRDVLGRSMNIRLSQDNILGSSLSLQGITGQDVKILIDGVPVIGRQNGNIDLSQINMNNVARIEIVEGPLSVNYGTDALAGTINIITDKNQKSTYLGHADLYYESNGNYNASAKLGYQKSKNTVQLTLGRNYFDGWSNGEKPFTYHSKIKSDSSRVQSWKPKEQYFASLSYARSIKGLSLRFNSRLFDENIVNLGYPRAPYGETALDDNYRTFRSTNTISLGGKISEHYRADFILSYNYYKRAKNTFIKDLTTLQKQITTADGDQDTSRFKAVIFRGDIASTKDGKLNYEGGYDINYETNHGQQIEGLEQNIGDYALFGTVEYKPVDGLTLKPGVRVAYNTRFKAPLIPSLNLRYAIPLASNGGTQQIILRGSYAKGFRAPSLKELYFDFVDINHNIHGNKDLKAEYSDNFILNVVYGNYGIENGFKLEWNNFYNEISNMIVLAQLSPSSAEYTYGNLGYFKTYGSSLAAKATLGGLSVALSGGITAQYNQLYGDAPDTKKYTFSPEMTGSILYDWKQMGLSFSLFYKFTGKEPGYYMDVDGNVLQSTLQSYQMADVSIAKSLLNGRLKVTAGSKNLFDITNLTGNISSSPHSSSITSSPISMGRTYFLGASVNLNYK